jgi:hypothetical protein
MNFTTRAFSPVLLRSPDVVRLFPPVSVLVVAVSERTVVLAADQVYVDLNASPPSVRFDEQKVFRGEHVLSGIVGVTDAPAGSLGSAVAECAGEATVGDAVRRFVATTSSWLPAIHAQWRAQGDATESAESLATVVFGGIVGGQPTAVQLNPTVAADRIQWAAPALMTATGPESFINAYGVVDTQLLIATTPYAQRHALGLIRGPRPAHRPPSGVGSGELLQHAYQLVDAAIVREAAVPRPAGWPAGVPVLGGTPFIRAADR